MMYSIALTLGLATLSTLSNAQSGCSNTIAPSGAVRPSVASGYRVQVVATGLSKPRGLQFDNAGNLLVIEQGVGSLTALTFNEDGGCIVVGSTTTVVVNGQLNHGIALSSDGKTLYASSPNTAWSWSYDSNTKSVSEQTTIVTNMATSDHTTRTLLLSRKVPELLLISRGSTSNIDIQAASLSSGHSQIKAFNVKNMTGAPYTYTTDGLRLGWGLRNSVGVAEHPESGGIYSVENSADQIIRDGVDVHQDNPGEEMNFHGYLNGTEYIEQGQNYGYPWCFTAWGVSELPDNGNLTVGSQFAIDASPDSDNQKRSDTYCAAQVAPRLTFQAHMAPLDIKFHNGGTEAWVSFHGSWDRTGPVGYKVSVIAFENGEPVAASNSKTAVQDILSNADNSVCPQDCFRPAGLVFDSQGRLFVASDATGEIYMVTKIGAASSPSSSGAPSSSATPAGSGSSSAPQPSSTSGAHSWQTSRIAYGIGASFLLVLSALL